MKLFESFSSIRLVHKCILVLDSRFSFDSQFIVTCTLAFIGLITPLSARHPYVPDWFLLTWDKVKDSWVPMLFASKSSRNTHVIFGTGFPVELQTKVTLSVSFTVVSGVISSIDGGTKTWVNFSLKDQY